MIVSHLLSSDPNQSKRSRGAPGTLATIATLSTESHDNFLNPTLELADHLGHCPGEHMPWSENERLIKKSSHIARDLPANL